MLGSALARLNCSEFSCFAFTRLSGKRFASFNLKPIKGSLHEKKTEIVWSFAKPGGGVPPNQTPKRFLAFSVEKAGNCTKLR